MYDLGCCDRHEVDVSYRAISNAPKVLKVSENPGFWHKVGSHVSPIRKLPIHKYGQPRALL
jgi:hypothetical protein